MKKTLAFICEVGELFFTIFVISAVIYLIGGPIANFIKMMMGG